MNIVNVGLTIDKKIPKAIKKFQDYLSNIKIQKTFFLKAATPHEIFDLILSFHINKSLGPNRIPIYILKINNNIFSEQLANIVNLSFKTGIYPDLCKLAKVIPLLCVNYRPISLLPIYSKIFEKSHIRECIPSLIQIISYMKDNLVSEPIIQQVMP